MHSINSVPGSNTGWLAVSLVALLLLSSCATQRPPPDHDQGEAQLAALTEDLRAAEAQVSALEQQRAQLDAELRQTQARLNEQQAQVQILQQRLEQARTDPDAAAADIAILNNQLEAARRDQEASRAEADRLRREGGALQTQVDGLQQQLSELEAEYQTQSQSQWMPPPRSDPSITAPSQVMVDLKSPAPVIKTVFYGTTRARLVRTTLDYLKPFLTILGLAFLLLAFRYTVKKIIKDEFQKHALLVSWLILGIPIIGLTVLAIRDTLQMRADDRHLLIQYGSEWRKAAPGQPAYERGFVDVSIPASRKAGEVNRPQLTRFEFVADPAKHFVLAGVRDSSKQGFYEELNRVIDASNDNDMFVFVHGFHNTFEDAAFRTAQIAHDMQFPGAPVFFSWPSQGAVLDYTVDAENVDDSIEHLRDFLQELHDESGAEKIHLLAHSMGSRALSNAILRLQAPYQNGAKFDELIFAAADIKATRLAQMVPEFGNAVSRVTLYASAHDSALQVSRALQGQSEDYQRAGETWPSPLVAPPMDTIDVSGVTTGHSYISNSGRILNDIGEVLLRNRVLDEDVAVYVPIAGDSGYWILAEP